MAVLKRMAVFIFGGQAAVFLVLFLFYSYSGRIYNIPLSYSEQQLTEKPGGKLDTTPERDTVTSEFPCNGKLQGLPEVVTLCDDSRTYFRRVGHLICFTRGTNFSATQADIKKEACVCNHGYFGKDCGIPEAAWKSCISEPCFDTAGLKPRSKPRRIIHGLNINHEIQWFEVRLREIGNVVDVFIVGESNYTAGGDPKPIHLLPMLRNGFLQEYHPKIIHIIQDHFPAKGLVDGWHADTYLRDFMGREGLKRIQGLRDDDLFLLLDADEIPTEEVLLFLKLYDGYPQPISLAFQWTVYGFFWKKRKSGEIGDVEDMTRVAAVASKKMIREVYDGNVMTLRRNHVLEQPLMNRISEYVSKGNQFQHWTLGTEGSPAGHHCSWCFTPEGIRTKLVDAQKDDKPRWGDYPEKLDLKYIANLIKNGEWFDNSRPFFLVEKNKDNDDYAPPYILQHKDRFQYLLTRNST